MKNEYLRFKNQKTKFNQKKTRTSNKSSNSNNFNYNCKQKMNIWQKYQNSKKKNLKLVKKIKIKSINLYIIKYFLSKKFIIFRNVKIFFIKITLRIQQ